MKTLKSILESSILADIDDQLEAGEDTIKQLIRDFICDNYISSSKKDISKYIMFSDKPNKDGKYEVSIDVWPYNISLREDRDRLTNDLFVWGDVFGSFICSYSKITSLEGAPKNVFNGCFDCSYCKKLKSIKGMPKRIDKGCYCQGGSLSVNSIDIKKISDVKGEIYY